MAATIWVKALTNDRRVIVSEYDEQHPTENHEIWIVGYPDSISDAGEKVVGNPPIEVGDTALVRQRIAEKVLVEVSGPAQEARQSRAEQQRQQAEAAKAEQERLAAEQQAGKGTK